MSLPKQLLLIVGMLLCLSKMAFSWNALGHRLIAQIALNHVTPKALLEFEQYNQVLNQNYKSQNLVDASTWLDELRHHGVGWFNHLHYVEGYFTYDNSQLPCGQSFNAVWAVGEAQKVLLNKDRTLVFEKALSLRILLHVVGDLHQPLHAASEVSRDFPNGDRGGNHRKLKKNKVADNLHAYWDKGAGLLIRQTPVNRQQLKDIAANIESHFPCHVDSMNLDPELWAKESQKIAIHKAYGLLRDNTLSTEYQINTQRIAEQRIALAGCRLAALLNYINERQL